jgi:hypothetical protein
VEQDQKPRERSFIRELVPDWRPTREQQLWATRSVIMLVAVLSVLTLIGLPFDITLWNWMDLLIIPVVLAIGGYLFTRSEAVLGAARPRSKTGRAQTLWRGLEGNPAKARKSTKRGGGDEECKPRLQPFVVHAHKGRRASSRTRVTDFNAGGEIYLDWAPDGDRIVFSVRGSEVTDTGIYTINEDDSNLTRVTNPTAGYERRDARSGSRHGRAAP